MYYINATPDETGNYGNPQSSARAGMLALPDELVEEYVGSMGFVTPAVEDESVLDEEGNEIGTMPTVITLARNEEAYNAYQEAHPAPPPPTPAEQREEAYNTEKLVEWDGEEITVTAAAQLWEYYAAEGSEKADELTALIAAAKAEIRQMYPEEG